MSDQEQKVLDLTVELWNEFNALPPHHPEELFEARLYIHQIQNLLAARIAFPKKIGNEYKGDFDSPPIGGFKD